jgi:hypothetical protein
VIGLTAGVYSDEFHDPVKIRRRFIAGCSKMASTIDLFEQVEVSQNFYSSLTMWQNKLGRLYHKTYYGRNLRFP